MGKNIIGLTTIFDFFLPRFCSHCKIKLTSSEKFICGNCLNNILPASIERIKKEFDRKFLNKNAINGFTSLFVFEKDKELQSLIHSLKYDNKFLAGLYIGELIAKQREEIISSWKIDIIVPIPLHRLRKVDRGYNQSYYIAKGLSKYFNISISGRILSRSKFTKSQTTLTLKEREENISGAFRLKKQKMVSGKNILLVDDVITTGATTNECAKVLLNAEANKVYAISAAIAD